MAAPDPAMLTRVGATFSVATALGQLAITVCTPRIVRVRLVLDGQTQGPSYLELHQWPPVELVVREGSPTLIETGALCVHIDPQPLTLTFLDTGGTPLLRVPIAEGVSAEICRTKRAGPPPAQEQEGTERQRISAHFTWTGEQHFYGLGEGGKQFDRLEGARQLWNSHFVHGPGSDIGVPLLLSTAGYGLFFDNTSDAALVVGRSDGETRIVYRAEGGSLDWYYLGGANLRGVLAKVGTLLGRAPLPPRWAMGFLQSTRHFEDTAELRRVPRLLRERRIPCDGLVFLSTYGDAHGWNRGSAILSSSRNSCPSPRSLSPSYAPKASRRSSTSIRCSIGTHRSSPRPQNGVSCSPKDTRSTSLSIGQVRTSRRVSATSTSPARLRASGGGRITAHSPIAAWPADRRGPRTRHRGGRGWRRRAAAALRDDAVVGSLIWTPCPRGPRP